MRLGLGFQPYVRGWLGFSAESEANCRITWWVCTSGSENILWPNVWVCTDCAHNSVRACNWRSTAGSETGALGDTCLLRDSVASLEMASWVRVMPSVNVQWPSAWSWTVRVHNSAQLLIRCCMAVSAAVEKLRCNWTAISRTTFCVLPRFSVSQNPGWNV